MSYWPHEEIPRDPDGRPAQLPPRPPTLAIEIRSPGEEIELLKTRCQEYLDHGSWAALIVDPTLPALQVEVLKRGFEDWCRLDLGATVTLPELWLQLPVAELAASLGQ
jgi:Uma2 family endonuclease